jgi:hypothetical protein
LLCSKDVRPTSNTERHDEPDCQAWGAGIIQVPGNNHEINHTLYSISSDEEASIKCLVTIMKSIMNYTVSVLMKRLHSSAR